MNNSLYLIVLLDQTLCKTQFHRLKKDRVCVVILLKLKQIIYFNIAFVYSKKLYDEDKRYSRYQL